MKKRTLAAAVAAASLGVLATAAPSMAKPATTTVTWDLSRGAGCINPEVSSDKDISNIVYTVRTVEMIDGVIVESFETFQVEYLDEEQTDLLVLEGEVTEIYVKSGNNNSNGGLGELHVPVVGNPRDDPAGNCYDGGGGDPTNA